jgi:hypothetical protein
MWIWSGWLIWRARNKGDELSDGLSNVDVGHCWHSFDRGLDCRDCEAFAEMSTRRVTPTVGLLEGVGSVGALLIALAAPCCLPLFAMIAGAIGITALGLNENFVLVALQAFAVIAVIGLTFGAWRHRQFGPLILGGIGAFVLFFSFHARFSALLVYLGLGGLCVASLWNYLSSRKRGGDEAGMILQSVITCPKCGHRTEETMPTNACLFFYDCSRCGATLKPKSGDCCVFCSYGSVPCPPIQMSAACCM